jgi:TetR/AcrR family transcriptional repressor of nem operon
MFSEGRERYDRLLAGKPPAAALAGFIDTYVSRRHRDSRDTGCPLPALSADLPRLPEAARVRFGEGVEQMHRRLASWLIELGKPDPQALAASALAEMVGAVSLSRAVADAAQSDRILETTRAALKTRLGLDPHA